MKKVIAFSGGRTSAYMLWGLLQGNPTFREDFIVLFCNTGKERDETLDFVHEVETRWQIPIVWLEYTRVPAVSIDPMVYPHKKSQRTVQAQQEQGLTTHWFKVVDYSTARRRNHNLTPFDELLSWSNVLPNIRNRMCSVQMKVRTMMRYVFAQGIYEWNDYIGIRGDEAHRAWEIMGNCPKYRQPVFPLVEANVRESDVLDFWKAQDFDLQLQSHEGNCDLCYLKSRWKRIKIAAEDKGAIDWWERQEAMFAAKPGITGDGKYFRKGEPFSSIREIAEHPSLFDGDKSEPDIGCGCADKGFVLAEQIDCEI